MDTPRARGRIAYRPVRCRGSLGFCPTVALAVFLFLWVHPGCDSCPQRTNDDYCAEGVPGGTCGDLLKQASCSDGKYVCPEPTFSWRLCASVGPPLIYFLDGGTTETIDTSENTSAADVATE